LSTSFLQWQQQQQEEHFPGRPGEVFMPASDSEQSSDKDATSDDDSSDAEASEQGCCVGGLTCSAAAVKLEAAAVVPAQLEAAAADNADDAATAATAAPPAMLQIEDAAFSAAVAAHVPPAAAAAAAGGAQNIAAASALNAAGLQPVMQELVPEQGELQAEIRSLIAANNSESEAAAEAAAARIFKLFGMEYLPWAHRHRPYSASATMFSTNQADSLLEIVRRMAKLYAPAASFLFDAFNALIDPNTGLPYSKRAGKWPNYSENLRFLCILFRCAHAQAARRICVASNCCHAHH
jgi:hypothetical protein